MSNSSLSSSDSSSFSSASIASTPNLEFEEDNLIEILKKSLKFGTENEFLDSEIEDLKEFFTVELVEVKDDEDKEDETEDEIDDGCDVKSTCSNIFWLKVNLPITIRRERNTESLLNENLLISFKIKLKDTKLTEINYVPYDIIGFKLEDGKKDSLIEGILNNLISFDRDSNSSNNSISILFLIEEFYIKIEESNFPSKDIIYRDYYYPVFDCRHWGRSTILTNTGSIETLTNNNCNYNESTTTLSISYSARALYDFQALMQGELSFKENDILIVLANLGNGWLTARRSSNSTSTDDSLTGLIPENYIERI